MRLIEVGSLWGRNYRMRYYVDGRRVSEADFDRVKAKAGTLMARSHRRTSSMFRTVSDYAALEA